MRQGKCEQVVARLTQRIRKGDYHVQGLSAERELAAEVGVSYMTARKAIQKLLDNGLLRRLPNGRLDVQRNVENGTATHRAQIALLVPAWESVEVANWNIALTRLDSRFNCSTRVVYYAHWDDPNVVNTLRRFDGIFLRPLAEAAPPPSLIQELVRNRRPVVVLSLDWSGYGVRSVRLDPPVYVQKLLDHLASLGHRKIDCLNVQPRESVMLERIAQWKLWLAAHGLDGELVDEAVTPYTEPISAAYQAVVRRIREKAFDCTALLCITEPAAAGAIRAMVDHGIRPGYDVAVCAAAGESRAEYNTPSLTALQDPDPKPYLAVCLEWMLEGKERQWHGPLLVQPADVPVVIRQSTVPDIDKTNPPERLSRVCEEPKEGKRGSA